MQNGVGEGKKFDMKKILIGLVFVAYAISSFIFTTYYELKEMTDINSRNKTTLKVVNWLKNERPEVKLQKLEEISREEKVNIYKLDYKPYETAQKQKIVLYAAIGNEEKQKQLFILNRGRWFDDKASVAYYLSSIETKDSNQVGKIELFSPDTIVEVRPLAAAKNENLRGTYLIDSKESNVVEKIKGKLTTDIGFKIENEQQTSAFKEFASEDMSRFLIIVLIVVFILIALSFLYYILLNFKELAIMKMLGYTNKELIFKRLMIENIRIHAISLGLIVIGQGITLHFYNHWSKWSEFGGEWILWQLVFTFGSIIVGLIPFLMVFQIRIVEMLKNKKPLKLVQFLNYSSKFIFSFILVVLFINLLNNYLEFRTQTANKDKWETTKHYGFYEYQDSSTGDRNAWAYETGLKSQVLFDLASKKGGMLIQPSDGIVFKSSISNSNSDHSSNVDLKQFKEYDPESGNVLRVNSNYLKNNPVYDLYGKQVKIDENYGDYLIILVPQKYRAYEKELLKVYKNWYQFKRFIDEDIHLKSKGKKVKPHKEVEIKLVYIRDGQKHFLYHPELEKGNQNYSENSVLIVVNSKNMGGDSYLSYMTGRYFLPYVANPQKVYGDLRNDIALAGLQDTILTTPLLYSVVDEYMFELENELRISLFLALLVLILEIVITIFMIFNYLERNKLIHAVKKISGFSFLKRHKSFMGTVILFWLILFVGGFVFKLSDAKTILLLMLGCLVFELTLLYFVIKFAEKKKTKDVLKGA